MTYILNIDTSIDKASVCLSQDGTEIAISSNNIQKDHSSWLQPAIQQLMQSNDLSLNKLDAVAVSIGPGSYTGLRIGLSTAKGLCYALNIPLIVIGTLEMMAEAAKNADTDLICPMIDARRMEVFTAVYAKTGEEVMPPAALILNENSYSDLLTDHSILFFGNGSAKLKQLINNQNAVFGDFEINASLLRNNSYRRYKSSHFNSLAYTEPMYIKQFYHPKK
ncbi:MAG: tRNA (adenosine(37)-N6)-threonylcarbamoyltransferase complex dimerization subunit type 1 TsaB [Chitinophagaceae bacterium]